MVDVSAFIIQLKQQKSFVITPLLPWSATFCMFQEVHEINDSNHSLYYLCDRNDVFSS
jgi:hypothetical protein